MYFNSSSNTVMSIFINLDIHTIGFQEMFVNSMAEAITHMDDYFSSLCECLFSSLWSYKYNTTESNLGYSHYVFSINRTNFTKSLLSWDLFHTKISSNIGLHFLMTGLFINHIVYSLIVREPSTVVLTVFSCMQTYSCCICSQNTAPL